MKNVFLKAKKGNKPFNQMTSNEVLSRKEKQVYLKC